MTLRHSIATALLLALTVTPAQAHDYVDLLPNDSVIVVSAQIRPILNARLLHKHSKIGKFLMPFSDLDKLNQNRKDGRKITKKVQQQLRDGLKETLKAYNIDLDALGVDVFKDVDRFSFGLTHDKGTFRRTVVLEGRFRPAKFWAGVKQAVKKHPKVYSVERWDGVDTCCAKMFDAEMFLTLTKGKALVICDSKERLRLAIKQAAKKAEGLPKVSRQLLGDMDKGSLAVVVRSAMIPVLVKSVPNNLKIQGLPPGLDLSQLLVLARPYMNPFIRKVPAVGIAVDLKKTCKVRLSLNAAERQDARNLSLQLNQALLLATILGNNVEDRQMRALLAAVQRMRVESDGNVVSVQGDVDEATFALLMKMLDL